MCCWMDWVYLLCLAPLAGAAPAPDRIFHLPGLRQSLDFKQYSGYLSVASGNQLFYWLTAAPVQQRAAPVMLWLNGGPGCSSMAGLMAEMGPFKVSGDQVQLNPYSWQNYANIVFLDAPAGVGFSQLKGRNYTFTDVTVAQENYEALTAFFQKFPELRLNDLYIGGESYGGTYVPMLADLISQNSQDFPSFKGILVGNGCLNERIRFNAQILFNYAHGLISEKVVQVAQSLCCGQESIEDCNWFALSRNSSQKCKDIAQRLDEANFYSGLDPYLLDYSCYADATSGTIKQSEFHQTAFKHRRKQSNDIRLTNCHHENEYVPYLNRPDVQQSIHVNKTFTSCSKEVSDHYVVEVEDMTPYVLNLVRAGKRVLFFNGDMDSVCSHIHNQQFVHQLDLPLIKDRSAWHLANRVPKTAGFVTKYKGVDYVTVNGAGHFVASAYEKPREALQVFVDFLRAVDYDQPVQTSSNNWSDL